MQGFYLGQMRLERRDHGLRQHRHPVLKALALAHDDLVPRKFHILHAQPHSLHQAHPAAIQQRGDQRVRAGQARQHGLHFTYRQHHGQAFRRLGLRAVVQPGQFDFEHLAVEEQQRALGLVLRRSGNLARHRQMGQKRLQITRLQILRVAPAVKKDIAFNPVHVSMLGADAILFYAQLVAHLIQQVGGICRGAFIGKIRLYHNFISYKNGALQSMSRIIHLEGAFTGAF